MSLSQSQSDYNKQRRLYYNSKLKVDELPTIISILKVKFTKCDIFCTNLKVKFVLILII
jgi:hypothetical protein